MISLAVKYRPKKFTDVCSQDVIIQILNRQLELRQFPNCYLFCGKTGTGKTTLARILAEEINQGESDIIEIDGASNNGVENIRHIIEDSKERSLISEYKIYIIDETHALTSQAWQAFLKCLEEPPKYTIFMFCTTEPNKIPLTIQNRMMKFQLTSIPQNIILNRLNYICEKEQFIDYSDGIEYISKIAEGSMRNAINYLETVSKFSTSINLENTIKVLGLYSQDIMFDITNNIIDGNDINILNIINSLYLNGKDLVLFIDQYIDFILDLTKFCLLQDINLTQIPNYFLDKIKYTTGIENNIEYFKNLLSKLLDFKFDIKYESNIKRLLEIFLIQLSRGE